MAEFDTRKLIAQAFYGKSGIGFDFSEYTRNSKSADTSIDAIGVGKSTVGRDLIGRPFFMDTYITIEGEKFRLPNEPLITIKQKNNIKKTEVIGRERQGAVLEFIANDNYVIQIRGAVMEDFSYPTGNVRKLNKISGFRGSLEIENDLLRLFGVYKIAVESLDLEEMVGEPFAQKYSINAISDTDFLADLTEKQKLLLS